MKDLITVFKRELKITFRRTEDFIGIVITPLLSILFGSILIFTMMQGMIKEQVNFEADGYTVNAPEIYKESLAQLGIVEAEASDIEDIKDAITNGDVDILIVFPTDFELRTDKEELCDIEMWYNSSETDSAYALQYATGVLDSARPSVFTVNADQSKSYDLIREGGMFVYVMEMFFPMYALMGALIAVQNIAAYSVAADKEHGFMSMLLITPVKRTHLAFGKALALFTVCAISAVSSLAGTIGATLIYPLMDIGGIVSFSFITYVQLFVCMLSASVAMTGFCFFVSTLAKSAKKAMAFASWIGMLIPMCSLLTAIPSVEDLVNELGAIPYLIPLFNMNFCLHDVISSSVSMTNLLIAIGINLLLAVVTTVSAAKNFNDEKVMQI